MIRYIFREGLDYIQLDGNSERTEKIKFLSYDISYSNILKDLRNDTFVDNGTTLTIANGYYNISSFIAEFNRMATNFEIINTGTEYYLECKSLASILSLYDNMGIMFGLSYNYSKGFAVGEKVKIDLSLDFGATHIQLDKFMLPLEVGKKIYYYGDQGIDFEVRDSLKFIIEYPLLQRIRSLISEKTSYVSFS